MKLGPSGEFFSKTFSHCQNKTDRKDPLVSPGTLFRGKTGKSVLVSPLSEMVHCDTIMFRKTFGELFWPVRVA